MTTGDGTGRWPLPYVEVGVDGLVRGPLNNSGPLAGWFADDETERVARMVKGAWSGDAEGTVRLVGGVPVSVHVGPASGGLRWVTWVDRSASVALASAEKEHAAAGAAARFAEEVAKETSDPMSVLLARLELLAQVLSDPSPVVTAVEHARKLAASIRTLRMLARGSPFRLEAFGVARVLDEALDLAGRRVADPSLVVTPADLDAAGDVAVYARALARTLRRLREGGGRVVRIEAERDRDGVTIAVFGSARARAEFDLADPQLLQLGGRVLVSWEGLIPVVRFRVPGVHRPRLGAFRSQRVLVVGRTGFAAAVEATVGDDGWEVVSLGDGRAAEVEAAGGRVSAVIADVLGAPGVFGSLSRIAEAHPTICCMAAGPGGPHVLPDGVGWVVLPLRRAALLAAMGRRVRERR